MSDQKGEGDEGDEGGSTGAAGSGGAIPFPLNDLLAPVDPVTHLPDPNWDPSQTCLDFPIIDVPANGFPPGSWDPWLRAQIVLGQFGSTDWRTGVTLGRLFDPTDVGSEIHELRGYIRSIRPQRLNEIMVQSTGASDYFGNMLMVGPTSRPSTWCLIVTGFTVGQMVAMEFKHRFMRPRPVQIYPALMPPIPTPGHPSYPNSHALQSGLAAECISLAFAGLGPYAWALATRIAQNREVAGLHYPSDKRGSWALIPQVMVRLKQCDEFKAIVAEAMKEWP